MSYGTQKNSILKSEQIYHYDTWNGFEYLDNNLHSLTLHCCSLSDGIFTHTILADSDWDSCQVENCIFQNLSLENSDITSTYFENCKFINVCFKGASAIDLTFIHCEFMDCDFTHIGLSNSSFINSKFTRLKLRQSTTTLNQFNKCCFIESKIRGNFLYNIFSDTSFEKSQMEYILMASNFGFSSKNFEELSWNQIDYKIVQQSFLDSKDVISAAIISLNIDEQFYDYSIVACMQIIINELKNGILVRTEQILFIKGIIDNLLIQKKLSLYTVIHLLNLLEKTKSIDHNIAIQKSSSAIQQLNGLLFEHYHYMIKQIHKELAEFSVMNKPITLKLVFQQEPSIPICYLLEQIMIQLGMPKPYPIRIKTAVGSFIEWIQGYDNILKCLQLLISILGLGISLKKAYHTKDTSSANEQTDKKVNISLESSQRQSSNDMQSNSAMIQIPESVLEQLNTVSTEQDIHKVLNILIVNGVAVNNNFQGYNNFNFKNIEIS